MWADGPLVCVVVTTYNVEKYIDRALESILRQAYRNIEVLVIDDASTDETPARIAAHADSDPRVKVIRLMQGTLGGAGQPTNIGMDSCSEGAEYVLIVDGDDWMERDALSSVMSSALQYSSDVVIADFDTFEQDESSTLLHMDKGDGGGSRNWVSGASGMPGHPGGKGTYTYTATVDLFNKTSIELFFNHVSETPAPFVFSPSYDSQHWEKVPCNVPFNVLTHPRVLRISPVPWRKLYRRDFIDGFGIRFSEGDYFYEDNAFHWLTLSHAARISKVDRALFHHRRNRKGQTSISFSNRDPARPANGEEGGAASSIVVDLRPGEEYASTEDDDDAVAPEVETQEQDEYWKSYYQASRLGGYFPNVHQIGRRIFHEFRYRKLGQCAKVAVEDVAKMYFSWVRASGWIVEMQKSPEMKAKFERLLEAAERHWYGVLMDGGFDGDMGIKKKNIFKRLFLSPWREMKDRRIDLSLILPTKDVADLLPDLLRALYDGLARSRISFEVFVVDDGSTDGTIQILREFAMAHTSNFYLLESGGGKSGAGRARNSAIPLVEGQYVYFADTDDMFDFLALAEAVRYASKREVDLLILPYKTEYVKPGSSSVDGMLAGDLRIWSSVRSLWQRWLRPHADGERRMAALRLINYPWKQLTASYLLRDANVFFGPTVVQNDVQFHWTSIAAARNVQFFDRAVCTHRKFDAALRNQLTKVQSSHRLSMLDAAGMTQRALARQGAFDGPGGKKLLGEWSNFFKSLAHWAKPRIPEELQPHFANRRDRFIKAQEELEPSSLGKWAYWQVPR